MGKLTPDLLLTNINDVERSYYGLLAVFQEYYTRFRHNYLYNELGEAVAMYNMLYTVLTNRQHFLNRLPHQFSVDTSTPWNPKLICSTYQENDAYLLRVIELIERSLPELQKLIEEGARVFDFVQGKITIREIPGATPERDVGYIVVLEQESKRWHLYNYSFTRLVRTSEPTWELTTSSLATVSDERILLPLEHRLREFGGQFPQLKSSTAFYCKTEMDFPFPETTLPVIRRMLIKNLAA